MRARSIRRNAREGGVRRGPLRGELGYEEEHAERQREQVQHLERQEEDKHHRC